MAVCLQRSLVERKLHYGPVPSAIPSREEAALCPYTFRFLVERKLYYGRVPSAIPSGEEAALWPCAFSDL